MDIPNYYFFILAAIIVIAIVIAVVFSRIRKRSIPQDPYIEALKYLIDRDKKAAFKLLEQAVRRGNAPAYAYIKLGELLREQGEVGKALQIHQSLTVKTDLAKREKIELYTNLADDYESLGRPERAVKVLESAMKNFSIKEPQIYASLAKHHHALGQRDKAFDRLKDLKRLGHINDRELALYLTSAAEFSSEAGDTKEARKLLQKALKLNPDCPPALLALGNLEEASDSADDAIRLWKRAAIVSPNLAGTALQSLEKMLFQRGKFGEIEKIYQDVLAERNGDEPATLSLASFYIKQGREEEALQLVEAFHTEHPESLGGSLLLASLFTKLRDGETLEAFLDDSVNRLAKSKRFICNSCGYKSETMRWHCSKCNAFDTFSTTNAI